jgi:hypothetical protein
LDHRFPNEIRARAPAHTEQGKKDLMRQATIGQKDYEDGVGSVAECSKGEFMGGEEIERRGSDESVASTESGVSNVDLPGR